MVYNTPCLRVAGDSIVKHAFATPSMCPASLGPRPAAQSFCFLVSLLLMASQGIGGQKEKETSGEAIRTRTMRADGDRQKAFLIVTGVYGARGVQVFRNAMQG